MNSVRICFSDEEYEYITKASKKYSIPIQQFCKDVLMSTNFSTISLQENGFSAKYEEILKEVSKLSKKSNKHFQLRDLNCWDASNEGSLKNQKAALGRAFYKDVISGKIKNIRITMTYGYCGDIVEKRDKFHAVTYEIIKEAELKEEQNMIAQVFTKKGQSATIASAYGQLLELYKDYEYSKEKAAGSLGGAVKSGFLERTGNVYTRVG